MLLLASGIAILVLSAAGCISVLIILSRCMNIAANVRTMLMANLLAHVGVTAFMTLDLTLSSTYTDFYSTPYFRLYDFCSHWTLDASAYLGTHSCIFRLLAFIHPLSFEALPIVRQKETTIFTVAAITFTAILEISRLYDTTTKFSTVHHTIVIISLIVGQAVPATVNLTCLVVGYAFKIKRVLLIRRRNIELLRRQSASIATGASSSRRKTSMKFPNDTGDTARSGSGNSSKLSVPNRSMSTNSSRKTVTFDDTLMIHVEDGVEYARIRSMEREGSASLYSMLPDDSRIYKFIERLAFCRCCDNVFALSLDILISGSMLGYSCYYVINPSDEILLGPTVLSLMLYLAHSLTFTFMVNSCPWGDVGVNATPLVGRSARRSYTPYSREANDSISSIKESSTPKDASRTMEVEAPTKSPTKSTEFE